MPLQKCGEGALVTAGNEALEQGAVVPVISVRVGEGAGVPQDPRQRSAGHVRLLTGQVHTLKTNAEARRIRFSGRPAPERGHRTNANELYNAASVFALAADRRKETDGELSKENCARRAIALLRQAVARGYRDAKHMKADDDLGALRERDDFKKLLAEAEKEAP
jgi:hypothetical protein